MKTSCLCSISVCHTIQLKLKSDFLQNFTTNSSCRTSGYNVTAMKVTEKYKKICCIGRIVSYVREMKTKVENIL